MYRKFIKDIKDNLDASINIQGRIGRVRDHKKLIFVDIFDVSGSIQCVCLSDSSVFDEAKKLQRESVVSAYGKAKKRPEKNITDDFNGEFEFTIEKLEILSKAEDLPFDLDAEINIDTNFDYRPLTLRREESKHLLKLQSEIVKYIRDFAYTNNFFEFQAPKIVGSDGEGGAGVFQVDYFEHKAYLATSPQLYKQIMVGVFERAFCLGQVFRAEKHNTVRHLNEYTSVDMEMGFIKDHKCIMKLMEDLMRYVGNNVEEKCAENIKFFEVESLKLPKKEFPSMKMLEAQKIIKEEYGIDSVGEPDLSPEDEKMISKYAKEKFDSDFLFVTHYPVDKRPVYTYEDEEDKGFTKSFDLLFRGVEIATGGQRINDHAELLKKIELKGLDVNQFSFYLQCFKYGMPKHGGFGMGLERLVSKFAGIKNTKEASAFIRDRNRIDKLLS